MNRRSLLIINPHSGTRGKRELPLLLESLMRDNGIQLEAVYTEAAGHAERLATDAASEGFESVIVAGGDGTVSEAASGLWKTSTALGIIPGGSGNGLARSLGLPQDFAKAAEVVAAGHTMLVDRGIVNDHPFYCTFGVGFDAAVSEKFARERRRGRLTYVKNTLQEFLTYRPEKYALQIGGEIVTMQALVIAVCNAPQYGNNAYIAPQAHLNDGLLDITVIHGGDLLKTTLAGIELLSGRIDKNILVDTFRVPAATISRLNDGPAHADGEPFTLGKRIDIACQSEGLKVLVPRELPAFRPIVTPLKSMLDDFYTDVRALIQLWKKS